MTSLFAGTDNMSLAVRALHHAAWLLGPGDLGKILYLSLYGSAVSAVSRISPFNGVYARTPMHSAPLVAWIPASSALLNAGRALLFLLSFWEFQSSRGGSLLFTFTLWCSLLLFAVCYSHSYGKWNIDLWEEGKQGLTLYVDNFLCKSHVL